MTDRLAWRPLVALTIVGSIILRLAVGTWGYSGESRPPKFGDFEAQRHWMEITLHLPPREWYINSTVNDLSWWGLDYPPLSGYQSWLCGKFMQFFEPESVALVTSRGYETPSSRFLMRWTALLSDLAVFFPAAFLAVRAFAPSSTHPPAQRLLLFAALVLQPAIVIIDHGHFQYNCISLGLALLGAALIARGRPFLGSIAYVLSLSHKHMALYYAPAFFAHLLGWCVQAPSTAGALARFAGLGLTVVLTVAAAWHPFLESPELLAVLSRLAPFSRGIFEDYVANFWCTTARVVKWNVLFDQPTLVKLCLGSTVLACLPAMAHQVRYPSRKGLLYCMATTGLAFFLFSYQVHEKSILLALLPTSALALEEPFLATWFPLVGLTSMFPLLEKDRQVVPYFALWALHLLLVGYHLLRAKAPAVPPIVNKVNWSMLRYIYGIITATTVLDLHIMRRVVPPPDRLPYLHDLLFTAFAFLHFVAYFVYLNYRMWASPELRVAEGGGAGAAATSSRRSRILELDHEQKED